MSASVPITLSVNGEVRRLEVQPGETLLETLRNRLRLTGAKVGCEEGECGACTVLVDGKPVCSCLVLSVAADGSSVETIEGLERGGELHRVQAALIEQGAVQCGYCTPGVVMSAVALLRELGSPTEQQVREALAGNLCRCTGYARIVRAIERVAKEADT